MLTAIADAGFFIRAPLGLSKIFYLITFISIRHFSCLGLHFTCGLDQFGKKKV